MAKSQDCSLPEKTAAVVVGSIIGVMVVFAGSVISIPFCFYRGWVLVRLWQWFGVEAFGIAPLTMFQACGLMYLAGFVLPHPLQNNKPEGDSRWTELVKHSLAPLFALAFGWILHWALTR